MPTEKDCDMKVVDTNKKIIEFKYFPNSQNETENQIFKFKKQYVYISIVSIEYCNISVRVIYNTSNKPEAKKVQINLLQESQEYGKIWKRGMFNINQVIEKVKRNPDSEESIQNRKVIMKYMEEKQKMNDFADAQIQQLKLYYQN